MSTGPPIPFVCHPQFIGGVVRVAGRANPVFFVGEGSHLSGQPFDVNGYAFDPAQRPGDSGSINIKGYRYLILVHLQVM
jgi:hypothetical protein